MFNRREMLAKFSLGTGAALLTPVLERLQAEATGLELPKRVVFVVRANGLRP